jgi:hypothetical protein
VHISSEHRINKYHRASKTIYTQVQIHALGTVTHSGSVDDLCEFAMVELGDSRCGLFRITWNNQLRTRALLQLFCANIGKIMVWVPA